MMRIPMYFDTTFKIEMCPGGPRTQVKNSFNLNDYKLLCKIIKTGNVSIEKNQICFIIGYKQIGQIETGRA